MTSSVTDASPRQENYYGKTDVTSAFGKVKISPVLRSEVSQVIGNVLVASASLASDHARLFGAGEVGENHILARNRALIGTQF